MVKGSNIRSLYNWCLQLVACIMSSNHSTVFKFLKRLLVAPATNVITEPFPLVVPNRSRKTCLALQCIRVVVCSTAFFIKVSLFLNNVYWNPGRMSLSETFDIHYYYHYCYCAYCTSFSVEMRRFHVIWKKISQNRKNYIFV